MIRKARRSDAVALSKINYLVIHEFFQQTAETDVEKWMQMQILTKNIESEVDSFSYLNAYVCERDGEIAGAMWLYDYDEQLEKYETMDDYEENPSAPLLAFLDEEQPEAKAGDLYLDTIAVAENWQGKGVASELLNFAKARAELLGKEHLSLIVDEKNPHAEQVYSKHGFIVEEENPMYGSVYRYMRYKK